MRVPPSKLRLVVAGCAWALGAAAVSGQGIYTAVALKSKEHALLDQSRELNDYFEQRSVLYKEPNVAGLVERVGRSIAPAPVDDYVAFRFFALRDPSPNAFALPNGDVYVHTGMLARLTDEAQLAAVLAHEVNHTAGHHSIVEYRSANKKIIAGMVLTGALGGIGSVISAGLYTSMYGFSRELEQEADDRAVGVLHGSVYDPHALPEIYTILAADYEGTQPRVPTIWSTHPQLEARALRTQEQVAAEPVRARDPAAFDAVVLPLRKITIRDYIQDDYPRTAVALAGELAARYPADPEYSALLGDAWVAMGARTEFDETTLRERERRRNAAQRVTRTRQERETELLATPEGRAALEANIAKARDAYRRAIAIDAEFAPAYRGLAEAAETVNEPRAAAQGYVDYLRRAPDAPDRAIVMQRLRALRETLRNESSNESTSAR
jgi:predicted Zn-dependent protease